MQLSKLIFLLLMIWNPIEATCGEFSSWWQKTPFGNDICKEKLSDKYVVGIRCLITDVELDEYWHVISHLERWYFYKNHIIGEFSNAGQKNYFIFNETNCQKKLFKKQAEYEVKLKDLNLVPRIWTRWYSENWGMIITSGDFDDGALFIGVILPALILFGLHFIIGLIRTKFDFKRTSNRIKLIATCLIIGRILLDIMPSSI